MSADDDPGRARRMSRGLALVVAMVVGAALGALAGLVAPQRHQAKALVVVGQAPTNSGAVLQLENPGLLAERLMSPGFVARIEKALHAAGRAPSDSELASLERSLTAKALQNTPLVTVSIESTDAELAVAWMRTAIAALADEHRLLLDPAVARVRADAQATREIVERSRGVATQLVPAPGRGGGAPSPLDIQQAQLFAMVGQDIRIHVERLALLEAALDPRNSFLTKLAEPITLDARRARPWWIAFALAGATLGVALVVIGGLVSPPRDDARSAA
jgi:hypothetical protein